MNLHFASPWALVLLVPVLLGAWLKLARPAWFSAALVLSTARTARRLPAPLWARLGRHLDTVLLALAAALAVVALARPQKQVLLGLEPEKGIDIILALDTSTSMKALDFKPMNRLAAAKRHAMAFIQGRRSDRIGIVAFGGYAFLQCPLTLDYPSLLDFLSLVTIDMTHSEGTAIGDAIAVATAALEDSPAASRVVILLTDGRSNSGAVDPITAAKAAAALGVKVYAIGTGSKGPAAFPRQDPVYGEVWEQSLDEIDEPTLQEVAHRTGGLYFRATGNPEMDDIFKEIDRLERSEVAAPPMFAARDLYPWFLLPSMILIGLDLLLARGLWVRLP